MLFTTWQFLGVFLPVTLAGYALLPRDRPGWRLGWLLVTSLVFYGWWRVTYVPLLLGSIVVNYLVAEAITRHDEAGVRRRWLLFGLAVNLGLLGVCKYTGFVLDIAGSLTGADLPVANFELPLAISFFTFTQIGYLVDVHRDRKLHHGPLEFSTFVVFFPHLIAGPIVRHWEVIPQFTTRALRVTRQNLGPGLALIILGLGKKVLLADNLAIHADPLFAAAGEGARIALVDAWLGVTAFTLQLYFDFSGYSDMAIGLARLFGVRFPENFDSPYKAGSIIEFWRRWHITLMRFFREYVYFPLGGSRCGPLRHVINIMATMLLSGLWHGAGWTFVIWGGWHGVLLAINHRWRRWCSHRAWALDGLGWRLAGTALTFVAVVAGWTLFRATDLASARLLLGSLFGAEGWTIVSSAFNPESVPGRLVFAAGFTPMDGSVNIVGDKSVFVKIALGLTLCWACPNSQQLLARFEPVLEAVRSPSRWSWRLGWPAGFALGALLFAVVMGSLGGGQSLFLYFDF